MSPQSVGDWGQVGPLAAGGGKRCVVLNPRLPQEGARRPDPALGLQCCSWGQRGTLAVGAQDPRSGPLGAWLQRRPWEQSGTFSKLLITFPSCSRFVTSASQLLYQTVSSRRQAQCPQGSQRPLWPKLKEQRCLVLSGSARPLCQACLRDPPVCALNSGRGDPCPRLRLALPSDAQVFWFLLAEGQFLLMLLMWLVAQGRGLQLLGLGLRSWLGRPQTPQGRKPSEPRTMQRAKRSKNILFKYRVCDFDLSKPSDNRQAHSHVTYEIGTHGDRGSCSMQP